MVFAYNQINPPSQPHSISGVTPTLPDFGAKKIHKIFHVFNPDPGY
jgi:hypothetical protein